MQGRPQAIIAGFGCKPPSLDYLRPPSMEITRQAEAKSRNRSLVSKAATARTATLSAMLSVESVANLHGRATQERLIIGRCRAVAS